VWCPWISSLFEFDLFSDRGDIVYNIITRGVLDVVILFCIALRRDNNILEFPLTRYTVNKLSAVGFRCAHQINENSECAMCVVLPNYMVSATEEIRSLFIRTRPIFLNAAAVCFSRDYLCHNPSSFKICVVRLSSFEMTSHRHNRARASRTMFMPVEK